MGNSWYHPETRTLGLYSDDDSLHLFLDEKTHTSLSNTISKIVEDKSFESISFMEASDPQDYGLVRGRDYE